MRQDFFRSSPCEWKTGF